MWVQQIDSPTTTQTVLIPPEIHMLNGIGQCVQLMFSFPQLFLLYSFARKNKSGQKCTKNIEFYMVVVFKIN